jgi:hypothetical protein
MDTATLPRRLLILASLALLMAATRMSHFGTESLLPDASLAVFLLGGLWLGRANCFVLLFAIVFGVDYFSAQNAVEAGWCLTPAYWGLVPTYAVLWLAGMALRRESRRAALPAASMTLLAVSAAFVLSNLSWYVASGMVTDLSPAGYSLAVSKYFPPYLGSALLYLVPVWLGWKIAQLQQARTV